MTLAETLRDLAFDLIGQRVRTITGSKSSLEDFESPPGDRGLFGPDSVAWKVHADFTAMMVGGLSSLIVQSLHPRALAAVWDHSDFRRSLKDRLGRTAYFVAATTYGSEALAMGAIHRVNAIHANIRGVDLKGQPYVANEPELVRWVHLVEVTSFLSAYQHLSCQPLSQAACDQYMAEMTRVGHLLGAMDLPTTVSATHAALESFQGTLEFDARAQDILRVIESYPTDVFDRPWMNLILRSAWDVMPSWALALTGRATPCAVQRQARRYALQASSRPIQWMLDHQGVSVIARRRVGLAQSV